MMLDVQDPKHWGGWGRRRPCVKTKQGWRCSSMVEHFPGMQEALEYIPSTAKWKWKWKVTMTRNIKVIQLSRMPAEITCISIGLWRLNETHWVPSGYPEPTVDKEGRVKGKQWVLVLPGLISWDRQKGTGEKQRIPSRKEIKPWSL